MSETTTNLQLPFLAAEQAQKHVILNETLLALDCLVQLSVLSRVQAAPPELPQEGMRYRQRPMPRTAWRFPRLRHFSIMPDQTTG